MFIFLCDICIHIITCFIRKGVMQYIRSMDFKVNVMRSELL